MGERFQIQDLLSQDASGVVFRALDTVTQQTVAVRRFFPFGPNGGGLEADEQSAYNIAIGRLMGISHPAMRGIICGGCDVVDGMPYIATEWFDGTPLQSVLRRGPLDIATARHLICKALEVCELLSQVFEKEAIWIETELDTIIFGDKDSGRGITFWISPLKWLGKNEGQHGFESIIQLTEEILGGKGKISRNRLNRGFDTWLQWLRRSPDTPRLGEAKDRLMVASHMERISRKKKNSRQHLQLGGSVTLVALVVIAWGLSHWYQNSTGKLPEILNAPQSVALQPQHPIFGIKDSKQLLGQSHQVVKLEGTLTEIRRSGKGDGKTLYLLFAEAESENQARGGILISKAQGDLGEVALAGLKGKKLRIEGAVRKDGFGAAKYPVIMIDQRSAIQEIR